MARGLYVTFRPVLEMQKIYISHLNRMRTNRNMACSTGITYIVLLTLRCERTGPYTYLSSYRGMSGIKGMRVAWAKLLILM